MTKEEAIKILDAERISLRRLAIDSNIPQLKPKYDALGMAIKALKEQGALEQIKWERDTALATLEEHGIGLRQKTMKQVDLISRQAAIRWVKTECNPYGKPTLDFENGKKVIEHLKQMPSADRPTGNWLKSDGTPYGEEPVGSCWCSECGKWLVASDEYDVDNNFCPNCGAKMEV